VRGWADVGRRPSTSVVSFVRKLVGGGSQVGGRAAVAGVAGGQAAAAGSMGGHGERNY
jgi:hypothetical protein